MAVLALFHIVQVVVVGVNFLHLLFEIVVGEDGPSVPSIGYAHRLILR